MLLVTFIVVIDLYITLSLSDNKEFILKTYALLTNNGLNALNAHCHDTLKMENQVHNQHLVPAHYIPKLNLTISFPENVKVCGDTV